MPFVGAGQRDTRLACECSTQEPPAAPPFDGGTRKVADKVLVVDDSQVIRGLILELLEHSGFETCSACDGREALEVFQREQPDLLISDLHMPKMNGFELTRKVRAFSDVPILILTGGSGNMGDDRVAAIDAGADAFLMKPFSLNELRARIKELLPKPSCV